jgi:purine-binding chemotaxis protein CheW
MADANKKTRNRLELEDDLYDEHEDTQKDKYLAFNLDREDYGIEIRHVTEIIGIQTVTRVPEMPDFIKGVINLRGKVIPVMDVRLRFRMPPREYDERTCIIVVDINDTSVGVVVDEVREVMNIPESEVEPPPKTVGQKGGRFIQGVGKADNSVIIILDVNHLLHEEELENLQKEAA